MKPDVLRYLNELAEQGIDVTSRTLWLTGDIDREECSLTARQIEFLSNPSNFPEEYLEPIKLVIVSPGGDIEQLMFLYDVITTCPAEIVTIGSGEIASAATLLLMCGDRRYITENCLVMTHMAHGAFEGSDDEIAAQAEAISRMSDRYWKLLERHSNRSASWWYKKSKSHGELWIESDKMIELGGVDGVIKPKKELPPISKRRLKPVIREIELELEGDDDGDD